MIAPACPHVNSKKYGRDRYGNQRHKCLLCGVTWIEKPPKLLGDMRIPDDKGVLALRLLLEGNSIRSTERLTGLSLRTILSLLKTLGRRAEAYWENKMVNLPAQDVQVDETWGFIGCKEKTRRKRGYGEEFGDAYAFLAIERNTKLLLTWYLGKRTPENANVFVDRLRRVTDGRYQVTSDGYQPYKFAIPLAFASQVDYAQLIKIYRAVGDYGAGRYSPPEIVNLRMHSVCGSPDGMRVCTSHIERENLNIRMGVRRMTRLTNAFSKKWVNHEYHLALYFLYHNFCRVHKTLKTTPAVKAGLTDHVWSVQELLVELSKV